MSFRPSIFTVVINGTPMLVFEAERASTAEDLGVKWALDHANLLKTRGAHGTDLPPVVKVRIARPAEVATYMTDEGNSGFYDGVRAAFLFQSIG